MSWRAGYVARLPVVAVPHFYKSLMVDSCWIAFNSVLSDWRKVRNVVFLRRMFKNMGGWTYIRPNLLAVANY